MLNRIRFGVTTMRNQWRLLNTPTERTQALTREERAKLERAAPTQHELLVEALDLVPRMSDDDPIAPALADWCRKVRAAIAEATS